MRPAWTGDRFSARLGRTAFGLALAVCALWPVGYLLGSAWPVLFDGGWLVHFATTSLPRQARTRCRNSTWSRM